MRIQSADVLKLCFDGKNFLGKERYLCSAIYVDESFELDRPLNKMSWVLLLFAVLLHIGS